MTDQIANALRADSLNPPLSGMSKDSVRRNPGKLDETAGVEWLQRHSGVLRRAGVE